jgi:hypothetical protein
MKKFVMIGLEIKKSSDFGLLGDFVPLPSGIIVLRPKLPLSLKTGHWVVHFQNCI